MNDNSGMGILIIPVGILLVIGLLGGAIWLTGNIADTRNAEANQTRAQADLVYAQGQARATVIKAQGQSRLDSAAAYSERVLSASQAFTIGMGGLTGAALPWLAVIAITSLVVVVVVMVLKQSASQIQPTRVIERQTVFLLQPGQSRREVYRLLADSRDAPTLLELDKG